MIGWILFLVTLAFLLFASYLDVRTKEIPDELSLSMIALNVTIRLVYSIYTKNGDFFIQAIIAGTVFAFFGYLLFLARQWGGGDFLLLIGMGVGFASVPSDLGAFFRPVMSEIVPFWASLLINMLMVGSVYGLFCVLIYGFGKEEVRKNFMQRAYGGKEVLAAVLLFSLPAAYLLSFVLLPLIIAAFWLLFLYAKAVEEVSFVRQVKVSELREEDWILKDIKVGDKVIASASSPCLSEAEMRAIKYYVKKGRLKGRVPVKEGIPFVPVFPLTLIVSLFFGDVMMILVKALWAGPFYAMLIY